MRLGDERERVFVRDETCVVLGCLPRLLLCCRRVFIVELEEQNKRFARCRYSPLRSAFSALAFLHDALEYQQD